jgi:hypothetical protein
MAARISYQRRINVHLIIMKSVHDQIETIAHHEQTKHEKVTMIVEAYAIVKPRTVMVHFEYALAANAAMMRTCGLWRHTLAAYSSHILDVCLLCCFSRFCFLFCLFVFRVFKIYKIEYERN